MRRTILILLMGLSMAVTVNAQQLQTMRNYYDWQGTKPKEVYTVIQGTGTKHGNYKLYTENGYLVRDCNFSNNILHGAWKEYYGQYFSTQLSESGTYNQGKKSGEWRVWDYSASDSNSEGKFYLKSISNYNNDELRDRKSYSREGELIQDMRYNGPSFDCTEQGYTRVEGTRKNGQWEGQLKMIHKDGSWEIATIKDGAREGLTTGYYSNGQKSSEVMLTYTAKGPNKIIGTLTTWHENGQLKGTTEYSNDGNETILSEKMYDDKGMLLGESSLDQSKNIVYTTFYDTKTGAKSYSLEQKPKSSLNTYIRRVDFYPNGNMKTEQFQSPADGILKKTYHENGSLAGTSHNDGTQTEYYSNGKISQKIFKADFNNKKPFENYDESGNMSARGLMDKDNNVLETTYYEKGVKTTHINEKTGVITSYNPSGFIDLVTDSNNVSAYYDGSGNLVGKGRDSEQKNSVGLPMEDYVGYYPNGQVKEKGVQYGNNKVGLWYLYSPTGKLSILENGTTRKPTKDETANHSQYLEDLVNTKVPQTPVDPTVQSARAKAEEDFLRGL